MIPSQDTRTASLHQSSPRERVAADALAELKLHGPGELSLAQVNSILDDLSRRLTEVATLDPLAEGYLPPFTLKQRYAQAADIPLDVAGASFGVVQPGHGSVVRAVRSLAGGSYAVLDTGGRLQVVSPRSDGTWQVRQPFSLHKVRVFEVLPCGGIVGVLHDSCLLVAPSTRSGDFEPHVFTKPVAFLQGTYGIQRHARGFYVFAQDRIGEWFDDGTGYSYRDIVVTNNLRCAQAIGKDSFVASTANRQLVLWRRGGPWPERPSYIVSSEDFIVGLGPLGEDRFYALDISGRCIVYHVSDDARRAEPIAERQVSSRPVLATQHTRCGQVVVYTSDGLHVLRASGERIEDVERVDLSHLRSEHLEAKRVTALHVTPSGMLAIAHSSASGQNRLTLWGEEPPRLMEGRL